jgi:hypothetical protein
VLKRKRPRHRLRTQDRIYRILLRRLWPAWKSVLVIVKPETVVAWHRAGFRLFWRLRSRPKSLGRPKTHAEIRAAIQKMVEENPTWGAPRVHGELLKLGLDVSERTVSRYLRRLSPRDKARQLWSPFLHNHRDGIVAMDFFTVPTLTFRVLYCFFVLEHGRRRILHFDVTEHLSGSWIVQQRWEAFAGSYPCRYAILDRDGKLADEVTDVLTSGGALDRKLSQGAARSPGCPQ